MSYSDTENEHHEAISGGIVALRNEVAKLTASSHNMRGQGLACEDPDRARALYESAAAYADAAYRVGTIANDFEQAESYRAGAMEAIGPVPTYDELEGRAAMQGRLATVAAERAAHLENLISGLDADLGGAPHATTEEVLQAAARAAHDARRFQGIREHAIKVITDQVEQGTHSLGTIGDVLTELLDDEQPELLRRVRLAVGADVPAPTVGTHEVRPLKLKIPPGLAEQFRRVARKEPADWSATGYQPSVGEIVSGFDVTDVDGERTVGKITYVDTDAVTVELARHRAALGWYLGYASLDRTELRPADGPESSTWTHNLQLLQQANPGALKDSALLASGHLDNTTPYVGKLDNGGLFVGLFVGTTDQGRVKLQRPIKGEAGLGSWGVRLEEVDPETVSTADPATAQEFHKLVERAEAEIHGIDLEAEAPGKELTPWTPEPSQIVTAMGTADGKRLPVQFVALDSKDPSKAVIQLPGELQTADGVDHVWETRKVDTADLAPALPAQMNAFMAELEAKGLDGMIR